jgi:hypothetical protein
VNLVFIEVIIAVSDRGELERKGVRVAFLELIGQLMNWHERWGRGILTRSISGLLSMPPVRLTIYGLPVSVWTHLCFISMICEQNLAVSKGDIL